jgi:hypothetical protein
MVRRATSITIREEDEESRHAAKPPGEDRRRQEKTGEGDHRKGRTSDLSTFL